jgi:Uma2 family endonuclease
MNVVLPTRLTVDKFLAWAQRQEKGRYELLKGRVVMQQSQNWGHAELRARMYDVLAAAIARGGKPFYAAPDGMTVRIGTDEAYEPDALVATLPKPERFDLEISNPVLVVEVLSPSTARRDLVDKLAGYFQAPSIQHYLVIDVDEQEVIWHRRATADAIGQPVIVREGVLTLDPPGLEISVADIFPAD